VASWSPQPTAEPAPAAPSAEGKARASELLDWIEAPLQDPEADTAATEVEETATSGSDFARIAALAASGSLGKAVHADQSSTDLEAYRARMRANGREFDLAGEGLNEAEDGIHFWGPIDNESSRARAAGQVLTLDQEECISCGTCEEHTSDVFLLPEAPPGQEEDKAVVRKQDGAMDLIQDAIDACPVTCINWIAAGEVCDNHSHGGHSSS